jgi:hypothetical protein
MPQIRAAVRSCTAPGSDPPTHAKSLYGLGDDLQVHPVLAVLGGVEGPFDRYPVMGMRVPYRTT